MFPSLKVGTTVGGEKTLVIVESRCAKDFYRNSMDYHPRPKEGPLDPQDASCSKLFVNFHANFSFGDWAYLGEFDINWDEDYDDGD